jgi:hypothetical protein
VKTLQVALVAALVIIVMMHLASRVSGKPVGIGG